MHLTLHLTTACNMRCSYCYAPPHDGAPMSEEIGRKAMQLASRLSSGASCGIVFFGGEPLPEGWLGRGSAAKVVYREPI